MIIGYFVGIATENLGWLIQLNFLDQASIDTFIQINDLRWKIREQKEML